MTDEQIKHMVNRFLGWRLPENFSPDAGISSFKPDFNVHTAHPMKHEPVGTNLFDCFQAEAMVRYMIAGMPTQDDAIVALQQIALAHPGSDDHSREMYRIAETARLGLLKT